MIIYASNGRQKADIPVDDNSTQVMELQGDNVLNLSFTLYEYVALEVNDYSEYMGRRYWLMERPRPEQVSTVEWKYDIKLYGIESLVKRFLVLHDTDGADEAVFTLTAPAREHVALVVASVNRGMGSGDWKVGMVEATGNLVIDYRGTFCHDALRQIAAQAGPRVEWWVEGQTVNLCRCEQGEEVTLAYDTGLTSLSCSTAEGFYTRLYPIGSSRNIDPQKYGHSRLQLPGGVKHVDVGVERYGVWHRFETDAFAAIYPRYIGTVTSVRREERKDKEGRSFTAWFFSDSSLPFDPNAYEIGGRVKRVSFQEGAELAGLGSEEDGTYYFEANFDSRTREWELITLWPHDDDTQLPGGQLVPKPGDRYIPWNIRMPDEYYPLAEREFREAVDRYNTEHAVDAAVYKALTDYLYLEEHDITLRLGSRVRLESAQYFPDTGFRCSRVTKITRRINRPSRMELEMSDARPAGMMESLHEDIADARRLVYRMTDGLPDVIRTNDSTPPSDSNVLSALRALSTFLRKDRPDTMPHLLKLLDGLETGTFAVGRTGGRIDRAGNGELGSLTLRDLLTAVRLIADGVRSKNYTPGDMGTGFGLTTGEGGSRLEVDYLLVRRVATFLELLIREMRHVGGTLVLSGASGKVVRVEDKPSAWRVHFKTREDGTTVAHGFTVGAQARCQTYNRTSGNTYYWRLVTAVGDDWVELSKSDYDKAAPTGTARTAPAVGDELVQLGHRTDARQTGAIVLDTVGEGAPSIRLLKDIRSYSLTDANVRVLLSPSTVRVIADEVSFSSGKTVEQTIEDSKENAIEAAKDYFKEQKTEIDNSIGVVSGKVDNLVIGGRNLLKYARLISIPATYAYGRGSYTTAVDTATLCEGQRSLKVTASKVGSEGGTDNFVWEAWNVVRQSECVTVSFYAKAATPGTRFSVRMGGDVCNFPQTVSLSTDWQRFEMTFREPGRKWMCIVAWFDRPGTVWVALPKMELGSRATDWSLAPEDVYNEAQLKANGVKAELNNSITDAKTAAQNVQKNLDNLTIGGRNLLRYSGLEKTPLNNIVYGRKPENVPVGVEEGYQGAKAVKLVFTTPGKPSVSEVMWRTWEERTDHNRVEPVVLRFWAKADKDNTRMWTALGYHGGKIARPTISSEWKEYTVNFMPDGPWALWCIGLDAPGTVWVARPKLEYGTKPTDWTPAPEDVDNSIDGVRNTANQASADAGDAKQKAGEAATSASKAESSAKNAEDSANAAKGKATEAAGSAKTASDKATNAANSASAAAESAQTAATNAAKAKADADAAAQFANASKEAADAAKTRLDSWAADNVISPMEKQGLRDETARIDADKSQVAAGYAKYGLGSYQSFTDAYNAYRAVLVTLSAKQPETISIPADFATKQRNYYTQRSTALTRIADAAKEYVDGLQIGGRNLAVGSARHNFANGGSTPRPVVSFIEDNTVPSGVIIQIKCEKDCKPGFYSYPNPVRLTVGETYTWSFYAKCSVKKNGTIGCEQGGQRDINLTTEWQRFTHTFTVRATTWWAFTWYLNWNAGEVLYIHSFKLEKGSKPTDWSLAPEDIAAEIAAKTEAARQAAQAEAIGLNKWIAQAYYTGENKAATPPKLEDIAGKTPTRTMELTDAQFNLSGSLFNMDNYTGIRTTYVYLDADYNLTTGIQHDDAGSLYVNGALVASGGIQTASWKSVTLPLKKGWNRIDGLWNEGGGGDFFKFQAPLENDAHIIQLACRPNVSIDPMRAVTMQSVEEQKAGFNTFNNQFTAWSKQTKETLAEYNTGLTKLTERVTEAELKLTHDKIWLGISEKVSSTVNEEKKTLVSDLKSKTGIDIQQGVITLDAQKVKIQNGSQTMAMFEGEKLKAELIDVNKIFSKDITVRNNATISNLRAKNAVIEGTLNGAILNGVKGTFTQLETSTKSFSVTERDMKVLGVNINQQGTQDGKDLYFFGQDIMARSMLGFGSLAAVDVPVSNGGESNVDHFVYMRWYDAVGYPGPTSRVHYPGQNVTHANRVNLYGNGRYTVNICGAKDGQVVVVMNRSAQEKYVVMTRNRDHWTHTLKAYTFGIYIAPGNTNRYGIHYVNDLFALAAP